LLQYVGERERLRDVRERTREREREMERCEGEKIT
jgi:hypothetical protein